MFNLYIRSIIEYVLCIFPTLPMSHDHPHGHTHQDLFGELTLQLQPLLESSQQAVYVFFDDEHKVCNKNFATLLGYDSAEEWAQMEGSFPALFVDESSQDTLIGAYQNAMQNVAASTINVRWAKKSGGTADSTVILVPLSYKDHLFALHFVA
jgi:hypothetical protein